MSTLEPSALETSALRPSAAPVETSAPRREAAPLKKHVATHEVTNQVPLMDDLNLYERDAVLRECVEREGGGWAEKDLKAFGAVCGAGHVQELARQANRHLPELKTHDRRGER